MRTAWLVAALFLCIGSAARAQYPPAPAVVAEAPPVINSVAFAVRPPRPGRLDYLQTIRFIDDGMKYIDPASGFFISPAGEMCFRSRPLVPPSIYAEYYKDWCIFPQTVDRVEAVVDDITNVNQARVWCRHAAPQCAHQVGFHHALDHSPQIDNTIVMQTVSYRRERDAVENLVYLMGGGIAPRAPAALIDADRR